MEVYVGKVKELIGQGTTRANETFQYGSREITRVATDFSSELQKAAARNNIPSPLPDNLMSETDKAAKILSFFTDEGGLKNVIPKEVIHAAQGIAIFTVVKAGLFWSARAGTGIILSRTPKGWSPPSGINIAGIGFGSQFGADVTNFVIILNTQEAVKAFSRGENITLGGSLSVSAGPVGMGTELSSSIYERSALYSYSNSKGFFAGVSLEGTIIMERKAANHEFYKKDVSAADILSGQVDAKSLNNSSLYEVLKRIDSEAKNHDRK